MMFDLIPDWQFTTYKSKMLTTSSYFMLMYKMLMYKMLMNKMLMYNMPMYKMLMYNI